MTDYAYGGRKAEIRHACRELRQLDLGYTSGALSEEEWMDARAGVRERYDLRGWTQDE